MSERQALDIEALEDLLREAMSAAKAQGIRIEPGDFGVCWNQHTERWCQETIGESTYVPVCPQGAALLRWQPSIASQTLCRELGISRLEEAITRVLGVEHRVIRTFVEAFDGYTPSIHRWPSYTPEEQAVYDLGRRLRAEVDAGMWS